MRTIGQHSALIIIDVQVGFDDPDWGKRNNECAEENVARLLAAWRERLLAIFHVQHSSTSAKGHFRPGQPGFAHKALAMPLSSEPVYRKSVNSAFIQTGLERDLRARKIEQVIIVGLTTPHCVSTTARMSGNLGFDTCVVEDATAAFESTGFDGRPRAASDVHYAALSDLQGEFAEIVRTAQVLHELS